MESSCKIPELLEKFMMVYWGHGFPDVLGRAAVGFLFTIGCHKKIRSIKR